MTTDATTKAVQAMFATRLDTLERLLERAEDHFGDASFLERRIASDMLPFGTQVAFTCNQPRNFALWQRGRPADNLDPAVTTIERARAYIRDTKELVRSVAADDAKLTEMTRLDLGPNLYADLVGAEYVDDFLIPNFYFHLVSAYAILRMAGVPIGKRDYMLHLAPKVRGR